jgi:hypothetical protein
VLCTCVSEPAVGRHREVFCTGLSASTHAHTKEMYCFSWNFHLSSANPPAMSTSNTSLSNTQIHRLLLTVIESYPKHAVFTLQIYLYIISNFQRPMPRLLSQEDATRHKRGLQAGHVWLFSIFETAKLSWAFYSAKH